MKLSEWLTILAILAGPVLAVQAQKWIELAREKRNLRLFTFKRLMATRGAILSPGHVETLNMIDLEFGGKGKKDAEVRRCWKEYLDNLGSLDQDPEKQKAQMEVWNQKNRDLLANLLGSMGKALGYDFDSVQILKGFYTPKAHTNLELELQAFRQLWVQVLLGNRAIPMDVKSFLGRTTLPEAQAPAPPQSPTAVAVSESPPNED